MELHKLTTEELRGYDAAKLRETEKSIRRDLVNIRMDIYTAPAQHTGKIRGLRKSLARLLTLQGAQSKTLELSGAKAGKSAAKTKMATSK